MTSVMPSDATFLHFNFLPGPCVAIFLASINTLFPGFNCTPAQQHISACSTWIDWALAMSAFTCSKTSFILSVRVLVFNCRISLTFWTECWLKFILQWNQQFPKHGEYPVLSEAWLFDADSAIASHDVQLSCWWLINAFRYCSMMAFIHSLWLSVCGWKAVESNHSVPSHSQTYLQSSEVNWGPLHDTIVSGKPWKLNTSWMDSSPSRCPCVSSRDGTKFFVFDNLSSTTHMALSLSHSGSPTPTFMLWSFHGRCVPSSELSHRCVF